MAGQTRGTGLQTQHTDTTHGRTDARARAHTHRQEWRAAVHRPLGLVRAFACLRRATHPEPRAAYQCTASRHPRPHAHTRACTAAARVTMMHTRSSTLRGVDVTCAHMRTRTRTRTRTRARARTHARICTLFRTHRPLTHHTRHGPSQTSSRCLRSACSSAMSSSISLTLASASCRYASASPRVVSAHHDVQQAHAGSDTRMRMRRWTRGRNRRSLPAG